MARRIPFGMMMVILLAASGTSLRAQRPSGETPRYERRWLYVAVNLQVDRAADELIARVERAGKSGYNGLVLADYKLNVLDRVERLKQAASKAGLEIVPCVFPIGYSSGLLAHDPNLAEGMPVVAAPFVVRGREARLAAPSQPQYRNGGMEEAEGDRLGGGFGFQDDPGAGSFVDRQVMHSGLSSLRLEGKGPSPNRRAIQSVEVEPHRAYRFSAWVRTKDLQPANSFRLLILGASEGGRALTFFEGGVEPSQEWKRVSVVFNSLDEVRVNAYVGLWGPESGAIWVDDVAIQPLGLTNVLRRGGAPFEVTSSDGETVYEEGRDFEPVADPLLGQVPWAGEYSFDHEGPSIRLIEGSRIADGERLSVSWYHPVAVYGGQVMCCPSEPRVIELLREQAQQVTALFRPRTFFMSHDEIRCLNWDRSCVDRGLTPGQILARNVEQCVAILDAVAPGCEVVTWSDMFDPTHNAVKGPYYLVNGSLEGSWLGLPSRVSVANWNSGRAAESLQFFANRGHRQILAGYYDGDPSASFQSWDTAAHGVRGVDGFLYTTWANRYDDLDTFGRLMRESPAR
jgi:hypothetical protein